VATDAPVGRARCDESDGRVKRTPPSAGPYARGDRPLPSTDELPVVFIQPGQTVCLKIPADGWGNRGVLVLCDGEDA